MTGLATASAAAAALFATAGFSTAAQACDDGIVKCAGINSGKGQGWNSKNSAAECTAAGGKVEK